MRSVGTTPFVAAIALAALSGCGGTAGSEKPLLTQEAFYAAVEKCGAQEAEFIQRFDGGAPSFSFLQTDTAETEATATSQCLADELEAYRFEAMRIRLPAPSSAAGR